MQIAYFSLDILLRSAYNPKLCAQKLEGNLCLVWPALQCSLLVRQLLGSQKPGSLAARDPQLCPARSSLLLHL